MSQSVYFNDSEPFVCDWLENLIREKLLPAGVVDRRPIQEVEPADVRDFAQCHFFAGIGGWAYALQLAGWGNRPVWTGSCPCQPFSTAGKGQAEDDPRHLWPSWFRLIRELRPERVFGEQVAASVGFGWWDVVSTDLEAQDYAVGAVVLGAHSAGAPHKRQRLWWVADADRQRCHRQPVSVQQRRPYQNRPEADGSGEGAGNSAGSRLPHRTALALAEPEAQPEPQRPDWWAAEPTVGRLADGIPGRVGFLVGLGNAIVPQVAAAFIEAYLACSLPAPEDRPQ